MVYILNEHAVLVGGMKCVGARNCEGGNLKDIPFFFLLVSMYENIVADLPTRGCAGLFIMQARMLTLYYDVMK